MMRVYRKAQRIGTAVLGTLIMNNFMLLVAGEIQKFIVGWN